ncbi:hypothetical protein WV31_01125 [Magnetospirillum sp. ME-1]|uniref:tyrosine-type recombinase/integrase n=1 Tax=Magnetospirillum sp. ME-1 TaxID=1639348 RepID=UPI000A17D1E8|nr:tyrosine-type recombinase/integrase [Magnetospirillum sp. ME-1]ARJ64392.1 hypothetical protein WV31_01125 [Magnetospirillum sp. ME-1]
MSFYSDEKDILGGRGKLYRRGGVKKPIWQCRLNIRGYKGYVVRSCGTTDYEDALIFARDLYDDLSFRVRQKLPLQRRTFRTFWQSEWLPHVQKTLSIHRHKLHKGTGERYFLSHFGDSFIEDIDERKIAAYWLFRRTYYTEGPGSTRKLPANAAIHPSKKTLDMEKSLLTQMFKYMKVNSYIPHMPLITINKDDSDPLPERRPHFEMYEWEKLRAHMQKWKEGGYNAFHQHQRKMLYCLVGFLMSSGLRPNEVFNLRWINLGVTEKGRLKVIIPKATKTGYKDRDRVPLETAIQYSSDAAILRHQRHPDKPVDRKTEYVFAGYNGEPMAQSHKLFCQVLEEAGLLKDPHGRNRTLYSLRHSFITYRLLAGMSIEDVARNTGSSVKQIQEHYDHIANEHKEDELSFVPDNHFENVWASSDQDASVALTQTLERLLTAPTENEA